MNNNDQKISLAFRMNSYSLPFIRHLPSGDPIVLEIKSVNQDLDEMDIAGTFIEATLKLMPHVVGGCFAYVGRSSATLVMMKKSDESLLWHGTKYGVNQNSLESATASLFTKYFFQQLQECQYEIEEGNAETPTEINPVAQPEIKLHFEVNAFSIPLREIVNYIIYKQSDNSRKAYMHYLDSYHQDEKFLYNMSNLHTQELHKKVLGADWFEEYMEEDALGYLVYYDFEEEEWTDRQVKLIKDEKHEIARLVPGALKLLQDFQKTTSETKEK